MSIEWWPAASDAPWAWAWRAYPGVWLVVVAAGAWLAREWGRAARRLSPPDPRARQRQQAAVGAVAVAWACLDWPLGALATSLLTAAAVQYLLLSLVAAPLLLYGLPRVAAAPQAAPAGRLWRPPLQLLTGGAFTGVLLATSAEVVVNTLRPLALGSMLIGALWLGSAIALWWPVLRRDGRELRYMAAVAYLFVPFILPKVPGLWYLVDSEPVYAVYRDAPRVGGLAFSALIDQRVAGAVLWSAGTVLVFVSLGLLFGAWYREERRASTPVSLEIPADPELVAELFTIPGAWLALERVIEGLPAALPAGGRGVELRMAVREGAGARRIAIEVHAPLDAEAAALVSEGMARDLQRHLGRLPAEQRAAIEAHLAFAVVSFQARRH